MEPLKGFSDKSPKKGREIPLYAVAALFILFIIGFYLFFPDLIPSDDKNTTKIDNQTQRTTTREVFLVNLIESDNLAIVMTVTDTTDSQAALIYNCGVGFSGSWGSMGKNISNLDLYVIEGDKCTYSTPSQRNLANESTVFTSDECTAAYADSTRFDIRFGPSSTIFTNRSAFVLIDERFGADCSFGIPRTLIESLEPVNLLDNLSNASDDSDKPFVLDDLINQRINKEITFVNATENETISNETVSNITASNTTESITNSTENVTE